MKWRENQVGFYFHAGDERKDEVLNHPFLKDNALQTQFAPTGYKDIVVVAIEFKDKQQVDEFVSFFSFDDSVEIDRG